MGDCLDRIRRVRLNKAFRNGDKPPVESLAFLKARVLGKVCRRGSWLAWSEFADAAFELRTVQEKEQSVDFACRDGTVV